MQPPIPTSRSMTFRLLAQNTSHRGPGKVYKNLVDGLRLAGHSSNQPIIGDHNFTVCLQPSSDMNLLDTSKTLFGPNLVVLPSEARDLFSDPSRHFLVPSKWVKGVYSQFDFVTPDNLHVWPVGIDTNYWKPSSTEITQDCFVYFKNRSRDDLKVVQMLLNKCGLKYTVLEYGHYSEEQLKQACASSRFAVLLTGTESQGIAYMEILSTNTPCYVFNKTTWESEDGSHKCYATSVPYFDKSCGTVCDRVSLDHFKTWLNDLEFNGFEPRTYIESNHTLEKAAINLVEIATRVLKL